MSRWPYAWRSARDIITGMDICGMYDMVGSCLEGALRSGLPATAPSYWMVVHDRAGVACVLVDPADGGDAPLAMLYEVFEGDEGVEGAALVSLVRPYDAPQLLAEVFVRNYENSDLRRARLLQDVESGVRIDRWEYVL
jgi:hypothetical protein